MSNFTILDVGHGNCSIIEGEQGLCVIDGGMNTTLLQFLRTEGVQHIDLVLVSHADLDHIKGLTLALKALPDLPVGTVLVNPAQRKETKAWALLVEHLEGREARHGTRLAPLRADDSGEVPIGDRSILEIISPRYSETLTPSDDNTISGVVRLIVDGRPEALFTADMDAKALGRILERKSQLNARLLVFPHHGGGSGGDMSSFSRLLIEETRPEVTVISMGRNMFSNPHPEIVAGIRSASHQTHIACTQLSQRCRVDPLPEDQWITPDVGGHSSSAPCIGSVSVEVRSAGGPVMMPGAEEHRGFVRTHVPERICESPTD